MPDSIPLIDPSIDLTPAAFIHPTAAIYGNVTLGEGVSIWPYVAIRTEMGSTQIGAMTNIQDFVMIHGGQAKIGAWCSITHHCNIHVCEIGDNVLVGINATVMDGAVIGDNCIIAGGSFIPEGTIIPPNSIVMGSPGKVRRVQNNFVANRLNAWMYHWNALAYARGEYRSWSTPAFVAAMTAERARLEAEHAQRFPAVDAEPDPAPPVG